MSGPAVSYDVLAHDRFVSLKNLGHGWEVAYKPTDDREDSFYSKTFDEVIEWLEDALMEIDNES